MRTKGALDKALEERTTVLRQYKRMKKAQRAALYEDREYGGRLRAFVETLNRFGPEHGDGFVAYVENECNKWLRAALPDIRYTALQACDERCMKIRERLGLVPIDDPLPGEPDSVFHLCKKAIGLL
jgi:hypothetical protein